MALGYKQLAAIENACAHDPRHRLRPSTTASRTASAPTSCSAGSPSSSSASSRPAPSDHLRPALQRLHVGTFTGPAGTYQQTTTPSPEVKDVFAALDVELPPKVLHTHTPAGPVEDSTPAA